jgi:hypothetical protein
MKLKLASLAFVAALSLSACDLATVTGAITGATVTPQVAQVMVDSYNTAEGLGIGYINSCHKLVGTAQACNRATEQKVFTDLRVYGQDRDAVIKLLRANNGASIPVVSYNTLMTVYGALKADLISAGITTS